MVGRSAAFQFLRKKYRQGIFGRNGGSKIRRIGLDNARPFDGPAQRHRPFAHICKDLSFFAFFRENPCLAEKKKLVGQEDAPFHVGIILSQADRIILSDFCLHLLMAQEKRVSFLLFWIRERTLIFLLPEPLALQDNIEGNEAYNHGTEDTADQNEREEIHLV